MTKEVSIGCIILAAGSSSRMGQSKQLLPINGEPLLIKTIKEVLSSNVDETLVVLGARQAEHQSLIKDLPIKYTINPNWQRGIGTSIKYGLQSINELRKDLDAVIISVCDQPFLTKDHINKLINAYSRLSKPVVASSYLKTTGTPALFDKQLYNNLTLLGDDEGAKRVIESCTDDSTTIPFENGEFDLDTIEDYTKFLTQLTKISN
ncbi:nucleotidyltransferase family protein [Chryseosolibacter indicus]|uniref:Nucleotidyltransferase family protein n=1 Tax=Chryseosolibacter indicus TaxID=2782351 RepID=A0ABS5VMR7_9BACT|nr:nucleotidyltransferase family protein [Chryseosolibacter indicus]MBT1702067.1 nucleotidyltransferase family protein [Chryseosolibacter indicus]